MIRKDVKRELGKSVRAARYKDEDDIQCSVNVMYRKFHNFLNKIIGYISENTNDKVLKIIFINSYKNNILGSVII